MDPKKLPGKVKTMIIGGFTVCGIAIAVWSIFFFKPSVGDNKNHLTIRFANIESIDVGTRVTYAGRPVGEVTGIDQILNAREEKSDEFGRPFSYEITIALDSSVHIYSTDLVEIHTSGLLGEKSIAIIPQTVQPGVESTSVIGGVIYAESTDPLTSTLKSVTEASSEVGRTMANISSILEESQPIINNSIKNLGSVIDEVTNLVHQANQLDLMGSLNRTAMDISRMAKNADQLMDQVRAENIVEKTGDTLSNIQQVAQQIANSDGTLGKLIMDPTLYLEATGLVDQANTLMNNLNSYGLLFHKNSRWKQAQRERAQALNSLTSPEAFKQAFEQEMQQISQSLVKVSDLIEKAESGNEEDVDGQEFKQGFYQLLNEVNKLQNLIELYNQKVTQPSS